MNPVALVVRQPHRRTYDVGLLALHRPRDAKGTAAFLVQQGFPPLPVVNGLSPLVQYIGAAPPANIDGAKTKERAFTSTLLVKFLYPTGWLVETPTITENGEAGKIAANNYLKGDFADFVAVKLPAGKTLGTVDKEYLKGFLSSQMTSDVFEDMKVKKVTRTKAPDGVDVAYIDFGYTLLTRAGFTVDRKVRMRQKIVYRIQLSNTNSRES